MNDRALQLTPFIPIDPSNFPTNVVSLTLSSTTIEVTWGIVPPIDQNGIITMYEVLYQPLETFSGAIGPLTRNVSGMAMLLVLMDLQEFVSYNISVKAYTSIGDGPYSESFTDMTLEDCKLLLNNYNYSQFSYLNSF
jgi:hypothetical protein